MCLHLYTIKIYFKKKKDKKLSILKAIKKLPDACIHLGKFTFSKRNFFEVCFFLCLLD